MHTQTLPHAQIQHDLLASTGDSVGADITVQSLDLPALATTAVAQTSEDLTRLAGAVLEGGRRLSLEASDRATQLEHSLGLVHRLALVDDVLEPVVRRLDLAGHVCQLETDDGVIDEPLAEGAALVGILDGLLVADTGEPDALDDNADALVVEVHHNH